MTTTGYAGIDVGLDGAIAVIIDGSPAPALFPMPTRSIEVKKKRLGKVIDGTERMLDEDRVIGIFEQLRAQELELFVMVERPQLRGSQWADHICPVCAARGIVKKHMLPGQSVTREAKFIGQYDFIRGVLKAMKIPLQDVHSSTWKADVFRGASSKDDARVKASQLFPAVANKLTLKKNDGLAEALLIADYGRRRRISADNAPF